MNFLRKYNLLKVMVSMFNTLNLAFLLFFLAHARLTKKTAIDNSESSFSANQIMTWHLLYPKQQGTIYEKAF